MSITGYDHKIVEYAERSKQGQLDGGYYSHSEWGRHLDWARKSLEFDRACVRESMLSLSPTQSHVLCSGPSGLPLGQRIPGQWVAMRPELAIGIDIAMSECAMEMWRARRDEHELCRALAGGMVPASLPTPALLEIERSMNVKSQLTEQEIRLLIGEVVAFREAAKRAERT
jgi:hypothetical protein